MLCVKYGKDILRGGMIMPTNLAIDDTLINTALRIGKFKSKKETVNSALREFIVRRKQKDIISLFGKIDYDDNYDYKKERKKR